MKKLKALIFKIDSKISLDPNPFKLNTSLMQNSKSLDLSFKSINSSRSLDYKPKDCVDLESVVLNFAKSNLNSSYQMKKSDLDLSQTFGLSKSNTFKNKDSCIPSVPLSQIVSEQVGSLNLPVVHNSTIATESTIPNYSNGISLFLFFISI